MEMKSDVLRAKMITSLGQLHKLSTAEGKKDAQGTTPSPNQRTECCSLISVWHSR